MKGEIPGPRQPQQFRRQDSGPASTGFDLHTLAEAGRSGEAIPLPTAESLLADNRSQLANETRKAWEENRENKNLYLEWGCSDMRPLLLTKNGIHVRTIAVGGSPEPFGRLISDPHVKMTVIMAHYDGDLVKPGEAPGGCGGQGVKEMLMNGNISAEKLDEMLDSARFVSTQVRHHDVVVNAIEAAAEAALQTEKYVLAVAQDHLDGTTHPLAWFSLYGQMMMTAVPWAYMSEGRYNPQKIYENGIPILDGAHLPDEADEYLDMKEKQGYYQYEKHHDVRKRKKVQKPRIVTMGTGVRPFDVRYPTSGPAFQITVPRDRIESTIRVEDTELHRALDQFHYPVYEHINNVGNPNQPFSDDFVIYIETEDIDRSNELAEQLRNRPWMQEWNEKPEHKILVGQIKDGVAHIIRELHPAV